MKKLPLVTLLLLTGCAAPMTAQERQEQHQAYIQRLAGQCSAMGHPSGSEGHRNCMTQLHISNQQTAATLLQGTMGQNPIPQSTYQVVPFPRPRQTHCYSNMQGHTTCTTY